MTATDPQRMEKIVSLCKRRGFIFQSSEIYGGLNGCWDYGPLGVELKRNVKDYWWRVMVREREDVVGMDGAILTHRAVLKASGHEDTFSDLLVEDPITKKRSRVDQVPAQQGVVYHYKGAIGRLTDADVGQIFNQRIVPILREMEFVLVPAFYNDLRTFRQQTGSWTTAVELACEHWPESQERKDEIKDC